jgi:hypothetical protein
VISCKILLGIVDKVKTKLLNLNEDIFIRALSLQF